MRRIVIALMSTVSGLVLLFSYHTSTSSTMTPGGTGTGGTGTGGTGTGGTGPRGAGGAGPAAGGSAQGGAAASTTVEGDPVMTRWGVVQVAITVQNKKITNVQVMQAPDGNRRDVDINNYALPILTQEAMQAQNANIDAVSGATVTSRGYIQSLQSAMDKAHL